MRRRLPLDDDGVLSRRQGRLRVPEAEAGMDAAAVAHDVEPRRVSWSAIGGAISDPAGTRCRTILVNAFPGSRTLHRVGRILRRRRSMILTAPAPSTSPKKQIIGQTTEGARNVGHPAEGASWPALFCCGCPSAAACGGGASSPAGLRPADRQAAEVLKYDSNNDGKPDTFSYMDGPRPSGQSLIRTRRQDDRWEYYTTIRRRDGFARDGRKTRVVVHRARRHHRPHRLPDQAMAKSRAPNTTRRTRSSAGRRQLTKTARSSRFHENGNMTAVARCRCTAGCRPPLDHGPNGSRVSR